MISATILKNGDWERIPVNVNIGGFSTHGVDVKNRVKVCIISNKNNKQYYLYPLEVEHLQGTVIQPALPGALVNHIKTFAPLADPKAVSTKVKELVFGIIIGNDFANAMIKGVLHSYSPTFVIKDSVFGSIISGPIPNSLKSQKKKFRVTSKSKKISKRIFTVITLNKTEEEKEISTLIRNFYEQEICGLMLGEQTQDEADQLVLKSFQQNLKRKSDGRYIIQLPWKDESLLPSENMEMALSRLKSQHRKLSKDSKLLQQYTECFEEWKIMGVIEKTSWEEYQSQETKTILPHHAVLREDHQTTKCRVVLDGSAVQEKSKYAINQCLETGPNLIPRLDSVLLRLRFGKFISVGDLAKAFLQLELNESDSKKLFLIWTEEQNPQLENSLWRFKRMPWGLNTSPFCLMATLHHHLDNWHKNPHLAQRIKKNLYVDDLVMTFDTEEQTLQDTEEAIVIFQDAKFELRKIRSNCPQVLQHLMEPGKAQLQESKILGTIYDEETDTFCISYSSLIKQAETKNITKRIALSMHSCVFDPLGLGSPWHATAKILMQETWLNVKGNWNAILPEELQQKWRKWASSAQEMTEFKLPRCISSSQEEYQLHYFADASGKAFAAVVYLQQVKDPQETHLLCSKVKVVPLKLIGKMSMPRTELEAAKLAIKVRNLIHESLTQKPKSEYFWSDSENVISWIHKPPEDFKVFVSNRIKFIRTYSKPEQWKHVKGIDNPADLPSRGCTPKEFLSEEILNKWLHGPTWLKLQKENWPQKSNSYPTPKAVLSEMKSSCLIIFKNPVVNSPLECYFLKHRDLNYNKIQKVMLQCLRFVHWRRKKKGNEGIEGVRDQEEVLEEGASWPTVEEQNSISKGLIQHVQQHYFQETLYLLQKPEKFEEAPMNKAKQLIYQLGLILEKGIIYVTGRISSVENDPTYGKLILMPGKGPIAWSLMKQYHHETSHGGANHMVMASRNKYWFLRANKLAQSVRRKCQNCMFYDRKPLTAPEATLPPERITPAYPFEITGLDFAGPLTGIGKSAEERQQKYYILIFTCAVTRAVDFELTTQINREQFILAFDSFKAQKGKPRIIYSDNAQTFRSVEKQITMTLSDWEKIVCGYTDIKWRFNVTRAAWWGGFFERVVRMVKDKLKRSFIKQQWETQIHAISALKTVEAAINSRPLGHVSMDKEDGRPICPADFLYYKSPFPLKQELQETLVNTINLTHLDNLYRKQMSKVKNLWRVFQQGYLQELRKYHYTRKDTSSALKEGQIVLISLPGQPRIQWPKGRIVRLIYGRDRGSSGPSVRAAYVRNYLPHSTDRKLKQELLSKKKKKQLTPAERLWISGSNSTQPIRYPVQLLVPFEMHGISGTEEFGAPDINYCN